MSTPLETEKMSKCSTLRVVCGRRSDVVYRYLFGNFSHFQYNREKQIYSGNIYTRPVIDKINFIFLFISFVMLIKMLFLNKNIEYIEII